MARVDDSGGSERADLKRQKRESERLERLDETLEAIAERLRQCTEIVARGREAFNDDWILRNAAHSTLIQIGEAAKDLPSAFRDEVVDMSRAQLIRTRDKAAHQYDQIDWEIVWTTISRDIPADLVRVLRIQAVRAANRSRP